MLETRHRLCQAKCHTSVVLAEPDEAVCIWTFDVPVSLNRLPHMREPDNSAIIEAEKAGFDLSLVDASLRLSPEERAKQHDQALALVLEFDRIRHERCEKPESITPKTR